MDRDTFYRLRDNRTDMVSVSGYADRPVAVVLGDEAAGSYQGQRVALECANLLARFARRLRLGFPSVRVIVPGFPAGIDLRSAAETVARRADPFIVISSWTGDSAGGGFVVSIGSEVPANLYVLADGWRLRASRSPIAGVWSQNPNPFGPLMVAAFAASDAFKAATGQGEALAELDCSVPELLGLSGRVPEIVSTVDIGRLLQVGAGAVGSAFDYALGLLSLAGHIHIVDRDMVKIHNLNRSPLFAFEDALVPSEKDGRVKVEVVRDYLHGTGAEVTISAKWFDEELREGGRPRGYDIWLPLANEYGVRGTIQSNLPPLMLHATTSSSWTVSVHRHIPNEDDCLRCRIKETAAQPTPACSTGDFASPVEGAPDAALPFQSAAAGTLLAAALVLLSLTGKPVPDNYAELNFRGPCASSLVHHRACRTDCVSSLSEKASRKHNAGTRYLEINASLEFTSAKV